MDKTTCKFHGIQNSIGNYDECEMCLIEDKEQQEEDRNNQMFSN